MIGASVARRATGPRSRADGGGRVGPARTASGRARTAAATARRGARRRLSASGPGTGKGLVDPLRHFSFLDKHKSRELFHRAPGEVAHDGDPTLLATALGATLYSPGTRPRLARDVRTQRDLGVISMVLCLEDAIPDSEVAAAEENVITALRLLADGGEDLPMVFVRVRAADQIAGARRPARLRPPRAGRVRPAEVRRGHRRGPAVRGRPRQRVDRPAAVGDAGAGDARRSSTARCVSGALLAIRRLLDKHAESVLAVRIGATDLSGMFGLRRDRDLTIYDIAVVRDAIGDIVNVLRPGRRLGHHRAGVGVLRRRLSDCSFPRCASRRSSTRDAPDGAPAVPARPRPTSTG